MSTTHRTAEGTTNVSAAIQFASMGIVWGASFLFINVTSMIMKLNEMLSAPS